MRPSWYSFLVISLVLVAIVFSAETLQPALSDSDYWKMINDFSEPAGYYQYNVITSNETSYQNSIPDLMKTPRAGGAYLGVGPEQNFTYIAALQPKIAFIFDIRREMMLEHLMYKSVFEMSANRVEFVSNLFARKAPAQLNADSPVETIFQAFSRVPADAMLVEQNANLIIDRLKTRHHFQITAADERGIRALYRTFAREGVQFFNSSFRSPGYATLMTLTDRRGKNWSYLATKDRYDRVRLMQQQRVQETQDLQRTLLASWQPASGRLVQIGTDLEEAVTVLEGSRHAIESDADVVTARQQLHAQRHRQRSGQHPRPRSEHQPAGHLGAALVDVHRGVTDQAKVDAEVGGLSHQREHDRGHGQHAQPGRAQRLQHDEAVADQEDVGGGAAGKADAGALRHAPGIGHRGVVGTHF